MGDTALPDEIVSQILTPALIVFDDAFSDTSATTFASNTHSTSAYLVVCKSWLRVATPLLYNFVILRSTAQAIALADVLGRNKDFGRFIKKLRVKGGYGLAMHTILELAPRITDLFLSLEIWSPDSTEGLCTGLNLINPTRLILHDSTNGLRNKMVNALVAVIPKWYRLAHGAKLEKLSLSLNALGGLTKTAPDLCPRLTTFSVIASSHEPPSPDVFAAQAPNASVTKIIFDIDFWPFTTKKDTPWDKFFAQFNPHQSLPHLREICFTCCEWPRVEYCRRDVPG
ncbi:hypothetical protein C8F01DRAFT_1236526 [Mycena amicta]|nr:hypothetical protein C8F01DRAFT_1236526 [Mycena amicta]